MPLYGIAPGAVSGRKVPVYDKPTRAVLKDEKGKTLEEPAEIWERRLKAWEHYQDVSITVRLNTRARVQWLRQTLAAAESWAGDLRKEGASKLAVAEAAHNLTTELRAAHLLICGRGDPSKPKDLKESAARVAFEAAAGLVDHGPMLISVHGIILCDPETGAELMRSDDLKPDDPADRKLLLETLDAWGMLEQVGKKVLECQDATRAERFLSGGLSGSPRKPGHGPKRKKRTASKRVTA